MSSQHPDLERAIAFHGHYCMGITIGYRASQIALRELKVSRASDEELVAVVYTASCAADAVQVLTGCTFGKGNLFFKDHGKHVYLFARRGGGRALRVALRYGSRPPSGGAQALLAVPEEELFKVEWVPFEAPPPAEVYPTVQCVSCGEGVMEPRARLRQGRVICPECAQKSGWFVLQQKD